MGCRQRGGRLCTLAAGAAAFCPLLRQSAVLCQALPFRGGLRSLVLGALPPQKGTNFAGYKVLMESTLSDLDFVALQEELSAQEWNHENLLVKVLSKEGAQNLDTRPWAGSSRDMTFQLRIGIPWEKVGTFLSMTGAESTRKQLPAKQMTDVTARHRVIIRPKELVVESSYAVAAPPLTMHVSFTLRPGGGDAHHVTGAYVFGGAVEFESDRDSSSILSYGPVRHFLELGFMEAIKRMGRTLLGELKERAAETQHRGAVIASAAEAEAEEVEGEREVEEEEDEEDDEAPALPAPAEPARPPSRLRAAAGAVRKAFQSAFR